MALFHPALLLIFKILPICTLFQPALLFGRLKYNKVQRHEVPHVKTHIVHYLDPEGGEIGMPAQNILT